MNPFLEQVKIFMVKFKHKIYDKQTIDDTRMNDLRHNLLVEELKEYYEGLQKGSKLEVLDALCDLQVVLSGAVIAHGFEDVFDDAFLEVQRSNMSKACQTIEEAQRTQMLSAQKGIPCKIKEQPNGTYFVERVIDGKTIKSVNYSPANLEQFIK